MAGIISELRRRRVLRFAGFYIVGAWALVEALDIMFEAWGVPAAALRYVIIAAFVGFPLALVFAWRYDITAQGIVRTLPGGEMDVGSRLGKADYMVLVAMLGIGAYVAWNATQQVLSTPPDIAQIALRDYKIRENSVAVLPFVDLSDDLADQYFGDGLAEELLNSLAKLKGLLVTARTSSFEFRGQERDIADIARQLRVATVVEGSVRKAGNRVRVTAQLINAADGFHIWSNTFDRDLDDIFAIQTEIAEAIAAELYPELTGEDKARLMEGSTRTPAAFDAYLRGREKWFSRNSVQMELAEAEFREAIRLDPDYALAHVFLADAIGQDAFAQGLDNTETAERMLPHVEKALEISPALPDAHYEMAQVYRLLGDAEMAEASFKRALELNPSHSRTLLLYGDFLRREGGQPEESIRYFRRAVELDPMSPLPYVKLGTNSWMLGDFDAGIKNYNKALAIDPEYPHTHNSMGFMYDEMQQLDKSAWAFRKAVDIDPASARASMMVSGVLVDLGDYAGTQHWIDKTMELSGGRNRSAVFQYRQLSFRRDGLHASREWWERSLEGYARDTQAGAHLRDIDLDNGTPDLALARYQQSFPELFPVAGAEPDEKNFSASLDLVFLLQHMDRNDDAAALLDKTAQFLTENPEQGNHWHRARRYALQGSLENAMIALIKTDQNDIGLGFTWGLETDRILDALHDHPDYIAMIERRNAELREQLASWERIKTEEGWDPY